MYRGKIFKTSLCLSAMLVSFGISQQDVSASTSIGSDIGIAGITPVIEEYYSSNTDEQYGEAEGYLIDLLQQMDQENGTNLAEVISPYVNLGISTASDYVNIRTEPNTESEVAGKLYNGCATDILGTEGEWVKIKSGNVEGYIMSEYLATGASAEELVESVAKKYAVINTETLYVRQEPNTEAEIVTMVPIDQKYHIEEEQEDWAKVVIDDTTGYVSKDYIDVEVEFDYAISIEEEQAKIAAEEAARVAEEERLAQVAREEEARRVQESQAAAPAATSSNQASSSNTAASSSQASSSNTAASSSQNTSSNTSTAATQAPAATSAPKETAAPATSSQGSATGQQIANYAVQFVGNPYVYGGTSLTNGTDCSGFTQSVYKNFGYNIPRTSGAQASAGTSVSVSNRQPGDIMAYPGHVAIYIGNDKIVHASTEKTGIKISSYNYTTPSSVRRIVQ